jgi:hypothetical protein
LAENTNSKVPLVVSNNQQGIDLGFALSLIGGALIIIVSSIGALLRMLMSSCLLFTPLRASLTRLVDFLVPQSQAVELS